MRRLAVSLVPPWLEPLLSAHFFAVCPLHPDASRGECNMFCLDCCGGGASSFCFYCRSARHSAHRVIQIRRSSYHDVVRVVEIENALDISGVQTYVINSARVLFLNERPQPRGGGRGCAGSGVSSSSPHICEICSRALLDPFRFCSLGCKLARIKRKGDATLVLNPGDVEVSGSADRESSPTATEERKAGRIRGWGSEGSHEETSHYPLALVPPSPPVSTSRPLSPPNLLLLVNLPRSYHRISNSHYEPPTLVIIKLIPLLKIDSKNNKRDN